MRILWRAQTFHRDDLGPVEISHLGEAGEGSLAVHNHCAGTALSFAIARLLGTGQSEILPEEVEQNPVWVNDELVGMPVDL